MTDSIYLSKSDFKVAQTCATKLYYKKLGYPTVERESRYTRMLSSGGFILEKTAQLLYPEGIKIQSDRGLQACIHQTAQYLQQENVTLFDAAIYAQHKLVRVDILIKQGNKFSLIGIRSKSFNTVENAEALKYRGLNLFRHKKSGRVSSHWRGYIEDIAYQTYVLQTEFPEAEIVPYLCMPDSSQLGKIERFAADFKIRAINPHSNFDDIEVDFLGDIDRLRANHFLTVVSVADEVNELLPNLIELANVYVDSLADGLRKIATPIDKNCKKCEFRGNDFDRRDGFKDCWGELAEVEPHILDLYQGGRVGGNDNPVVNNLIEQGKVSLYDMPIDLLENTVYLERQLVQIENTFNDREWISHNLKTSIAACKYPLHFIDFETAQMPIPYHKVSKDSDVGIKSYEQIAFQWSCHTIESYGEAPIHSDWLSVGDVIPNFEFAETLMAQLGDTGTVFTWATHENNVLRDIYFQMDDYGYENLELKTWLSKIVKFNNWNKTRLVDMNAMTLKYYFHPRMKAKTSLKSVLPAIWVTNPYLYQLPWLATYFKAENGKILNPYDVLSSIEISEQSIAIKDGTGAMTAYLEMLFGQHSEDEAIKQKWQDLLRQYCQLDTMAMVIIWTHWNHLVELSGRCRE